MGSDVSVTETKWKGSTVIYEKFVSFSSCSRSEGSKMRRSDPKIRIIGRKRMFLWRERGSTFLRECVGGDQAHLHQQIGSHWQRGRQEPSFLSQHSSPESLENVSCPLRLSPAGCRDRDKPSDHLRPSIDEISSKLFQSLWFFPYIRMKRRKRDWSKRRFTLIDRCSTVGSHGQMYALPSSSWGFVIWSDNSFEMLLFPGAVSRNAKLRHGEKNSEEKNDLWSESFSSVPFTFRILISWLQEESFFSSLSLSPLTLGCSFKRRFISILVVSVCVKIKKGEYPREPWALQTLKNDE